MALVKCKECKKEVSSSAKSCPHCGVKDPSTTFGHTLGGLALVGLLIWGASHLFGGDDSSNAKDKNNRSKTCSTNDGQCLFDQNWTKAAALCRPLVEKSSKYDYEWTDGLLMPMFSHFRLDEAKKQLTFIGDKVKFTNGFNAKLTMTYECALDLNSKQLVGFDINQRRL